MEIEWFEKDTNIIGYAVYQIRADDFFPEESYVFCFDFYRLNDVGRQDNNGNAD